MRQRIKSLPAESAANVNAYLPKRLAADGADISFIFILFLLFSMVLLKTPLADTYHEHAARCRAIERQTAAALDNDAAAIGRALSENDVYQYERFAANLHSYLLKAGAGFLAEGLVLLAVPLMNRQRATPGKLMTGIMPFHDRRQGRISAWQTAGRFAFVFLLDSLFWYLYAGILTFLLVPILRLTEILLSRKRKTLCDYVTGTRMIEAVSYDGIN